MESRFAAATVAALIIPTGCASGPAWLDTHMVQVEHQRRKTPVGIQSSAVKSIGYGRSRRASGRARHSRAPPTAER